eukprot:TRINITY_DN3284_c1_g1_i1.p1 TRINITY_DN3284_c1_g1~~TRINITY_DN3284_c1_g1_i1.p1  ORF type:complete len:358 (-),score=37.52 TRINITY_DN3284_c1_g1_i1:360-1433(-)
MLFLFLWVLASCSLGVAAKKGSTSSLKGLPVAVFHGMSAHASIENGECDFLQKNLGWDCHSIEYAPGMKTITVPVAEQARNACALLQRHPSFKDADEMALIGHSNGGMVSRWVLQNCEMKGKFVYYVSVGGPQRGITKVPRDNVPAAFAGVLDWIVERAYLWRWVQNLIGPAGYVYNPQSWEEFQHANTFLGKLNNEADEKNVKQKEQILALKGMLLIQFEKDKVVVPRASEWFGQTQKDGVTYPLERSGTFYDDDLMGLKTLQRTGRLKFYMAPREHDKLCNEDRTLAMLSFFNGTFPSDSNGYYNGVPPTSSKMLTDDSKSFFFQLLLLLFTCGGLWLLLVVRCRWWRRSDLRLP